MLTPSPLALKAAKAKELKGGMASPHAVALTERGADAPCSVLRHLAWSFALNGPRAPFGMELEARMRPGFHSSSWLAGRRPPYVPYGYHSQACQALKSLPTEKVCYV